MLLGYNTNGFAHHALPDALELMAEAGYRAVALTPDVNHLDPYGVTPAELRDLRRLMESLGLAVVIETGARYLLDPRRKHRPNLLEPESEGRQRRLDLLTRCCRLAAELGASTVSIWSGTLPEGASTDTAWDHLRGGVATLCDAAAGLGVRIAFEPEPGMFVETLEQWSRLRAEVDHPSLGLTLDTGHVLCTESVGVRDAVLAHREHLFNVHLDDVRGRVHDHLQIGEGEIDWPEVAEVLRGWDGVASVELSRHSHDAPRAAATAMARLQVAGFQP